MAASSPPPDRSARLAAAAAEARRAEDAGDGWAANEAWRRHRMILDGGRDPQDLLDEGVEMSKIAIDLARRD